MKLSPEAIRDFKQIFMEKRGIKLTDEEAERMGWELLQIANLTLKNTKNERHNI